MPGQMVLVPTDSLYKYISPTRVERGIKIYEFKVSLRNISPKVERQILVQGDYTLEQLGRVAACAIGWDRGRFNLTGPDGEFIKGYRPWCDDSESDSESCADEPKEKKAKARTAREIYISEQFNRQNKTLVMNFGKDGWIHDIKFVKTQDRDLKLYPKCIGGKNACPLEGCGGPEKYKYFLKTLKNPKHKDHKHSKLWLNLIGQNNFNPTKFKMSAVVFPN